MVAEGGERRGKKGRMYFRRSSVACGPVLPLGRRVNVVCCCLCCGSILQYLPFLLLLLYSFSVLVFSFFLIILRSRKKS